MYQDKQAKEEKRKQGNRPSQIGQVKGPLLPRTGLPASRDARVRVHALRGSLVAGERAERGTWGQRERGGGMRWSAVTWCSAGAVQPVFNRTSSQALPETPLGVSPSHRDTPELDSVARIITKKLTQLCLQPYIEESPEEELTAKAVKKPFTLWTKAELKNLNSDQIIDLWPRKKNVVFDI
jgi:hypothetical protein